MPTIATNIVTLQDVAKRLDPGGSIDVIVEMLKQKNAMLDDMHFVEGNLPTGHKATLRTGLPTGTWRKLNAGVPNSKSETTQITASCGILEAYAEVDKRIADLNGNSKEFRLSEDRAHIQGMNHTLASAAFYGNVDTDPEKINGLVQYYNDKSAASGANILSGGGTSTNTSIYLVTWGPDTTFGLYPKGSKAGLQFQDLGEVTLFDTLQGKYQGYRSHYSWDFGLFVKNWKYNVRIANIDIAALLTAGDEADTSANILKLMSQAVDLLPDTESGRMAFYANPTVLSMLRVKLMNKSNIFLTMEEYLGRPRQLKFMDVPIRRCDSLISAEETVTGF